MKPYQRGDVVLIDVPTPVTRYEVEQIISTYTNKVRNDLRAIKRMLKEGAENG